jgi:hypothetical protein
MKVDFNNVRTQTIRLFNELTKKLNQAICEDVDMNRVIIPVQDLQRTMDRLRDKIVTIGLCEDESNPEIKCVLTDDMEVLEFNPEE